MDGARYQDVTNIPDHQESTTQSPQVTQELNEGPCEIRKDDIKRAQMTIRQVCKQIESATYEVEDPTTLADCLRNMTSASVSMSENLGDGIRKRADQSFKTLSQQAAAARKIKVKQQGPSKTINLERRRNLKGQMWRRAECSDVASSIIKLYIDEKQNSVEHLWEDTFTDKELVEIAHFFRSFISNSGLCL